MLHPQGLNIWSLGAEAVCDEVNEWIRTSGAYDQVADVEAAVRQPAGPDSLRPEYDSGDGIHLNDAGYEALAQAIALRTLWPAPLSRTNGPSPTARPVRTADGRLRAVHELACAHRSVGDAGPDTGDAVVIGDVEFDHRGLPGTDHTGINGEGVALLALRPRRNRQDRAWTSTRCPRDLPPK
jgi:hypothetical protein